MPSQGLVSGHASRLECHESGAGYAKFFELSSLNLIAYQVDKVVAKLIANID